MTLARVLIVDDHQMVRDAMASALAAYDDVEVAATASSFAEAQAHLQRSAGVFEVVVSDLWLGDGEGADLASVVTSEGSTVPVLVITGADQLDGVKRAITAGCAGFVGKAQGFDRLVDAIRVIAAGGAVFPADLLGATIRGAEHDDAGLTMRELEVLGLLARARTVDEIATELFLSPHTIRNHVKQVLVKLGAHSQLEAVVIAARRGLVEVE